MRSLRQRSVVGGEEDVVAHRAQQVLDVEKYMQWMAVNALLKNPDTLDELFLYEVRGKDSGPAPLRIMAWDYDDLFVTEPKPDSVPATLLFSGQDRFDFSIKRHPQLYEAYRKTMRRLLSDQLTIEKVIGLLRQTQALRDGLDDGLPEEDQKTAQAERAEFVKKSEDILRKRHAELLKALDAADPSTPR